MTGQNDWNKQQEWLLKICDALKEMQTKYEGGGGKGNDPVAVI